VAGLPAALDRARSPAEVDAALTRGFLVASRAVLAEALRLAECEPDDPALLMCTTALVGLLRGDELVLGASGDSRAFLLREGRAEQLTVDGDVRCALLATGTPPEEVAAMGGEAASLYCCLGVSLPDDSGRLAACPQRCAPRIARFRLRPGDVLVLATDGLVEEGAFLEPGELPPLVDSHPEASAAELATALVEAARARHREPSEEEPEGFGDDVTCVVVRVHAASEP
jgi:serine/threonine protein phosphatase PrpC